MALHFGLGQVSLIPSGANPTPVPIALLTDLKLDIDYKEVAFKGSFQYAVDVALSEGDIKVTAKHGDINGGALSAILAGSTTATGSVLGVQAEPGTIPATPYQVTVTQSATWSEDLGVLDLTANKWLARVASAPTTGQYSVTAGVYTFAAADTGHNVAINYSYTSAAIGKTVTLLNQPAGTTAVFALACYNAYQIVGGTTRYMGWRFPAVICTKLSTALNPTKHTERDLSFTVRQDTASTQIAKFYTQD